MPDTSGPENPPTPYDWTRLHYGICPQCRADKFIGHGPLCTDCYITGSDQ